MINMNKKKLMVVSSLSFLLVSSIVPTTVISTLNFSNNNLSFVSNSSTFNKSLAKISSNSDKVQDDYSLLLSNYSISNLPYVHTTTSNGIFLSLQNEAKLVDKNMNLLWSLDYPSINDNVTNNICFSFYDKNHDKLVLAINLIDSNKIKVAIVDPSNGTITDSREFDKGSSDDYIISRVADNSFFLVPRKYMMNSERKIYQFWTDRSLSNAGSFNINFGSTQSSNSIVLAINGVYTEQSKLFLFILEWRDNKDIYLRVYDGHTYKLEKKLITTSTTPSQNTNSIFSFSPNFNVSVWESSGEVLVEATGIINVEEGQNTFVFSETFNSSTTSWWRDGQYNFYLDASSKYVNADYDMLFVQFNEKNNKFVSYNKYTNTSKPSISVLDLNRLASISSNSNAFSETEGSRISIYYPKEGDFVSSDFRSIYSPILTFENNDIDDIILIKNNSNKYGILDGKKVRETTNPYAYNTFIKKTPIDGGIYGDYSQSVADGTTIPKITEDVINNDSLKNVINSNEQFILSVKNDIFAQSLENANYEIKPKTFSTMNMNNVYKGVLETNILVGSGNDGAFVEGVPTQKEFSNIAFSGFKKWNTILKKSEIQTDSTMNDTVASLLTDEQLQSFIFTNKNNILDDLPVNFEKNNISIVQKNPDNKKRTIDVTFSINNWIDNGIVQNTNKIYSIKITDLLEDINTTVKIQSIVVDDTLSSYSTFEIEQALGQDRNDGELYLKIIDFIYNNRFKIFDNWYDPYPTNRVTNKISMINSQYYELVSKTHDSITFKFTLNYYWKNGHKISGWDNNRKGWEITLTGFTNKDYNVNQQIIKNGINVGDSIISDITIDQLISENPDLDAIRKVKEFIVDKINSGFLFQYPNHTTIDNIISISFEKVHSNNNTDLIINFTLDNANSINGPTTISFSLLFKGFKYVIPWYCWFAFSIIILILIILIILMVRTIIKRKNKKELNVILRLLRRLQFW